MTRLTIAVVLWTISASHSLLIGSRIANAESEIVAAAAATLSGTDFQLCLPLSTANDLNVRFEAGRIRLSAPLASGPVAGVFTPDQLLVRPTTPIAGSADGDHLDLTVVFQPVNGWSEEHWAIRFQITGDVYVGEKRSEVSRIADGLQNRYTTKAMLRAAPPVERDVHCNWHEHSQSEKN